MYVNSKIINRVYANPELFKVIRIIKKIIKIMSSAKYWLFDWV